MNDVEKWFDGMGRKSLRKVGLKKGQTVLDFGCGSGNYTVPASQIVGDTGKVYALDKKRQEFWPSEGLNRLHERADSLELENLQMVKTTGDLKIDLETEFVDVTMLYDVFHRYYFPKSGNRKKLIREIRRVIKQDGFLSFYAGDPEFSCNSSESETLKREIKNAGFVLEEEIVEDIIHENVIQEGHILKFAKERIEQEHFSPVP